MFVVPCRVEWLLLSAWLCRGEKVGSGCGREPEGRARAQALDCAKRGVWKGKKWEKKEMN